VTGTPGPLIASGRDADIFAYGDGLVLRRSRRGRSMVAEAEVMEYVRARGYPVPAVDHLSDDGTDLVMQRVEGRSMVDALGRKPWTLKANGTLLGDLHRRLHAIEAPESLRPGPGPEGPWLLHLDLHPLNVLVGPGGPMVIDWTNAARGQGATDVALTWALMAAGEIPGSRMMASVMGRARGVLVGAFLRQVDDVPTPSMLRTVVEWKVKDPNMSEAEHGRMWEAVRRAEAAGAV
jgi:aminoglycoside phosphotransferase (APT) family kinase protein